MTLTRRVHFLIDPAEFEALENLAQARRKATGQNVTLGVLLREAVADYLAKWGVAAERPSKRRKRSRPSR